MKDAGLFVEYVALATWGVWGACAVCWGSLAQWNRCENWSEFGTNSRVVWVLSANLYR